VSETVSPGREDRQREAGQLAAGQRAETLAGAEARVPARRRRGGWAAAGLAVVLAAAGAASAWRAGVFSPAASSGTGQGAPATATAPVRRLDLSAVTQVSATLGYAGSYTVTGRGGGTLTWLPPAGQMIRQGQALYKIDNGSPVVLLYGSVPDWRDLDEGVTGADVSQLNHELVALGDAPGTGVSALGWDYFSAQTRAGVQKLQSALGVTTASGSLPLGSVVFAPAALRVTQVTGAPGGPAAGPVLQATSDRHVVMIALDASDQSEVKAGDAVTVTLPDGTTTPGVVSSVGTVASTSASGSGSGPVTTIPVQVTMTDPGAAGTLDQAPVTVNITTDSVRNALAVPVYALLAQAPARYVVEVAGPGGTRRYVPVTVGVFDDADGMVQVTGALTPGQRVVTAPGS
jgi:hypothetical protein